MLKTQKRVAAYRRNPLYYMPEAGIEPARTYRSRDFKSYQQVFRKSLLRFVTQINIRAVMTITITLIII